MSDIDSTQSSDQNSPPPAPKGGRVTIFGYSFSVGAIIAWIAVLALLVILAFGLRRAQQGPVSVGQMAPNFTLTTFDGQPIELSDLRGKVVVINFWASWCIPCKNEAPALEAAWRHYQPDGKVVFLGIDWTDTETKAKEFLNQFDITYPNGPDLGTRISQRYRMGGIPETYIVDPQGKLAWVQIGEFNTPEQIQSIVDPLISQ
jgi:cytochrome c biogenesis protein CcmG/thiol:disulfide interchange protein DsbE